MVVSIYSNFSEIEVLTAVEVAWTLLATLTTSFMTWSSFKRIRATSVHVSHVTYFTLSIWKWVARRKSLKWVKTLIHLYYFDNDVTYQNDIYNQSIQLSAHGITLLKSIIEFIKRDNIEFITMKEYRWDLT